MSDHDAHETLKEVRSPARVARAVPGLVMIHAPNGAACKALALDAHPTRLGRSLVESAFGCDDALLSRAHAEVSFEGDVFAVRDLDSLNGTWLDGRRIAGELRIAQPRVLRVGSCVFRFTRNVAPFLATPLQQDESQVIGPILASAYRDIVEAAELGRTLLLLGQSGAGKELAARHYHRASDAASGPFVAVNCAAIPPGVAERLLFGTQRGAYSGADANAPGYIQSADRGLLFLDEIAELDLEVQAKLLRVLETGEVLPLGATRASKVSLRLCAATHEDLKQRVAAGEFREDLYYRIGIPAVRIPPLHERLEELSYLCSKELARLSPSLRAGTSFIEACALRAWPGNVRELLRAVTCAAIAARREQCAELEAEHLGPLLGGAMEPHARVGSPTPEQVEQALREEAGNVSRAARRLGVHRNQVRRLIARTTGGRTIASS